MTTNIKVGIATADAVLTYVEDDTTVGSNGTGDNPRHQPLVSWLYML